MSLKNLLQQISENITSVIERNSPLGDSLWERFIKVHPADIAGFLSETTTQLAQQLFIRLPKPLQGDVFEDLTDPLKVQMLQALDDNEKITLLKSLPVDELTDIFDYFSGQDLKKYLNLLHKKERTKVLKLMKFNPDSAGGIMDVEVLTLMQDFTVEKSIKILQRLRPHQEIHQQIYVTDKHHQLVGYINLQDLVLHLPKSRISSFMRKNEFVVHADDDQEKKEPY